MERELKPVPKVLDIIAPSIVHVKLLSARQSWYNHFCQTQSYVPLIYSSDILIVTGRILYADQAPREQISGGIAYAALTGFQLNAPDGPLSKASMFSISSSDSSKSYTFALLLTRCA